MAHQRPARPASLAPPADFVPLGGYSWLSIDQWLRCWRRLRMKEGNALIPIATAQIQNSFLSSRYHHC